MPLDWLDQIKALFLIQISLIHVALNYYSKAQSLFRLRYIILLFLDYLDVAFGVESMNSLFLLLQIKIFLKHLRSSRL